MLYGWWVILMSYFYVLAYLDRLILSVFNQNIFYVFYSVWIKLKSIVKSKIYSDTLYMFI